MADTTPVPPRLHIAVIGPGALGTLFTVRLAISGISVLLFDYRPSRAAILDAEGLRLLAGNTESVTTPPVTADPRQLADIDLALVLVKSYRTESVAATLAEFLPEHAVALTLQNGLGNLETLQLHLGADRVFAGATAQGALLEAPGLVRDMGGGPTILGSPDGQPDARLDDIAQALLHAGFSVSITENLAATLWNKLLLNAAINPVGALTRLRNGELAAQEPARKLMIAAAREAYAVARAHGVELAEQDWAARLQAICQATAPNRNSMLQDVLSARRTEIDAINGAIVRVAEQHHLTATVNRTLHYLVSALERGYADA